VEVRGHEARTGEPAGPRADPAPSARDLPQAQPVDRGGNAPNPLEGRVTLRDYEELLARTQSLEAELARYRAHTQRTSRLFQSVTTYVDWVRQGARDEAELALRKARARAERLELATADLERTEAAVEQVKAELERLQALTDATRNKLLAFLSAGIDALDGDVASTHGDEPRTLVATLEDALHERASWDAPRATREASESETPAP
jgi:DNA repair exonuclease SbcCD ATPase subunit